MDDISCRLAEFALETLADDDAHPCAHLLQSLLPVALCHWQIPNGCRSSSGKGLDQDRLSLVSGSDQTVEINHLNSGKESHPGRKLFSQRHVHRTGCSSPGTHDEIR